MRAIATAALAALIAAAAASAAVAQAPGPYDVRYSTRVEAALSADVEAGSKVVGTVPAGTSGLVLRWCRPEIPFGTWQYGSAATWRKLLDERRCEIGWKGRVGFVDGTTLVPGK